MIPKQILEFWFHQDHRPLWFQSTPEFDREIAARFGDLWQRGRDGQLADWESDGKGALALVILFDQFPLNMFRGRPESFVTEAASRAVAERAIERGFDQTLKDIEKAFLYMPFMHSESLEDQQRSVDLFTRAGLEHNLKFARHHRDIIHRFGRFPHRNAILGRSNTTEEEDWLSSPEAFHG